jgi:WhiB family redox-sensing transcriptional regulator
MALTGCPCDFCSLRRDVLAMQETRRNRIRRARHREATMLEEVATVPPAGPWITQAACADVDTDLFFPERGEDQTAAKAICATCPVRAECLAYALETGDPGIWGGTSERQRKQIKAANNPIPDEHRALIAAWAATVATDHTVTRKALDDLKAAGVSSPRNRLAEALGKNVTTIDAWAAKIPACGTVSAYKRHLRLKEAPCEPCKAANRAQSAAAKARRAA